MTLQIICSSSCCSIIKPSAPVSNGYSAKQVQLRLVLTYGSHRDQDDVDRSLALLKTRPAQSHQADDVRYQPCRKNKHLLQLNFFALVLHKHLSKVQPTVGLFFSVLKLNVLEKQLQIIIKIGDSRIRIQNLSVLRQPRQPLDGHFLPSYFTYGVMKSRTDLRSALVVWIEVLLSSNRSH